MSAVRRSQPSAAISRMKSVSGEIESRSETSRRQIVRKSLTPDATPRMRVRQRPLDDAHARGHPASQVLHAVAIEDHVGIDLDEELRLHAGRAEAERLVKWRHRVHHDDRRGLLRLRPHARERAGRRCLADRERDGRHVTHGCAAFPSASPQ